MHLAVVLITLVVLLQTVSRDHRAFSALVLTEESPSLSPYGSLHLSSPSIQGGTSSLHASPFMSNPRTPRSQRSLNATARSFSADSDLLQPASWSLPTSSPSTPLSPSVRSALFQARHTASQQDVDTSVEEESLTERMVVMSRRRQRRDSASSQSETRVSKRQKEMAVETTPVTIRPTSSLGAPSLSRAALRVLSPADMLCLATHFPVLLSTISPELPHRVTRSLTWLDLSFYINQFLSGRVIRNVVSTVLGKMTTAVQQPIDLAIHLEQSDAAPSPYLQRMMQYKTLGEASSMIVPRGHLLRHLSIELPLSMSDAKEAVSMIRNELKALLPHLPYLKSLRLYGIRTMQYGQNEEYSTVKAYGPLLKRVDHLAIDHDNPWLFLEELSATTMPREMTLERPARVMYRMSRRSTKSILPSVLNLFLTDQRQLHTYEWLFRLRHESLSLSKIRCVFAAALGAFHVMSDWHLYAIDEVVVHFERKRQSQTLSVLPHRFYPHPSEAQPPSLLRDALNDIRHYVALHRHVFYRVDAWTAVFDTSGAQPLFHMHRTKTDMRLVLRRMDNPWDKHYALDLYLPFSCPDQVFEIPSDLMPYLHRLYRHENAPCQYRIVPTSDAPLDDNKDLVSLRRAEKTEMISLGYTGEFLDAIPEYPTLLGFDYGS